MWRGCETTEGLRHELALLRQPADGAAPGGGVREEGGGGKEEEGTSERIGGFFFGMSASYLAKVPRLDDTGIDL